MCHRVWAFANFSCVQYTTGFLFIKEEDNRSYSYDSGILSGGKKCKVLQGGYKMTAGIYSTLVTPYFMALQGSFAAAEQ